jgi:hypothetical protein
MKGGLDGGTSNFKGVSWSKQNKIDGKLTHFGFFDDEEAAARAYDEAAVRVERLVDVSGAQPKASKKRPR